MKPQPSVPKKPRKRKNKAATPARREMIKNAALKNKKPQ